MDQDEINYEMNRKCTKFFHQVKELLGKDPLSCVETQMGSTVDVLAQGQIQLPCNFNEVKEENRWFRSIYENAPRDINERGHNNVNSKNIYNKKDNVLAHMFDDGDGFGCNVAYFEDTKKGYNQHCVGIQLFDGFYSRKFKLCTVPKNHLI